jgi:hypothetical protein
MFIPTMEASSSIFVHSFDNIVFQIDNVPIGTTASTFLIRLASLDLPGRPPMGELALQIDDQILSPTDIIQSTEVNLVIVEHVTPTLLSVTFVLLFLLAHVLAVYFVFKRRFIHLTFVYLPLV